MLYIVVLSNMAFHIELFHVILHHIITLYHIKLPHTENYIHQIHVLLSYAIYAVIYTYYIKMNYFMIRYTNLYTMCISYTTSWYHNISCHTELFHYTLCNGDSQATSWIDTAIRTATIFIYV